MNLETNNNVSEQYIYSVTEADFNSKVIEQSAEKPVLVDFWADWCGPCQSLMPVLEGLAEKYAGQFYLAKINADEEQSLAMQLGVRSLPTVVLFKDGQPVEHFMGALPESEIVSLIEPHLDAKDIPEDNSGNQDIETTIQGLIDAQQWQEALSSTDLLSDEDEKHSWKARIYLAQNELEQAKDCLAVLSEEVKASDRTQKLNAELQLRELLSGASENLHEALTFFLSGSEEAGVEQLLHLLSKDTDNQQVRKALLSCFKMMEDIKKVSSYRRQMASFVF